MADKAISELTAATQVGSTDLFVLEQGNVAKKLTGQILENWLIALADGHGGIISIEKTGTSGIVDTYTITFSDNTTVTFTVTNGKGVSSVTKTSAVAPSLVDTYTMTFTDNTTYQWTVSNGKGITNIAKTSTSGLVDTYTITFNDATTKTFTVTNGKGITSITDKWAVSSSNTQTPSTWYNAAPEMTPTNKYLWHYSVIAYNNNTTADTTKAVVGVYGDTGQNWYVWIKYAAHQPTQNSDMTDNPSNWIGMYSGTSSTAPSSYTSYTWSQFRGNTGNGIASIAKTGTSGLVDTYTVTYTDTNTMTFNVTNGVSITDVELTSTSGLTDTYTITFNDGTTTTFPVTNGKGIVSVSSPTTVGLVDTYTITYNDGTTSTFTVTNAKSITSVGYVSSSGLTDTYRITYNDGTSTTFTVTNGKSISTIAKTSTSGLVDTYTITFNNNTTTTFTVTNGSSISSIAKTGTNVLVDTYTVTLTDGTTSTFTVTNAKSITSIVQTSGTHAAGTTDIYTINYNDGDSTTFSVYNGANGEGAVSSVSGIPVVGDQGDVPAVVWGNGAPTTSTVGYVKQLYYDLSGGIMYICTAISGSTYTWSSMGITVDSSFSTTSSNPVRNSVISNKVGTGALSGFTATDLTGAANELMQNKADKTATVSTVTYDSTNHKLKKTINGTTSDVMTVDATPTNGSNNPVTSDGVYDQLALKAPLDSPAFTTTATAPTPTSSDNSTKIATTAYVKSLTGTAALDTTAQTLNGAVNELNGAILSKLGKGNLIVVDKNGTGQYTSIATAVQNASNGDTILVLPSTYEETVEAFGKELHIIGIEKESCIVVNHNANYLKPAFEFSAGSIENLTIISDGSSPTTDAGTGETYSAASHYMTDYCIHIDDYSGTNKECLIDNCILENNHHAALGIGLYDHNTVTVSNCTIKGGKLPTNVTNYNDKKRGAIFVHSRYASGGTFYNVTEQLFKLINCDVSCDDILALYIGNPNTSVDMTGKTNKAILQFNNNSFQATAADGSILAYSYGYNLPPNYTTDSIIGGQGFTGSAGTADVYIKLHPSSAGNNLTMLNNEAYPVASTITNSITGANVIRNTVYRAFNVTTFLFYATYSTPANVDGTLAVIPKHFKPANSANILAYYVNESDVLVPFLVSISMISGNVTCWISATPPKMKALYITGSYATAETADL